VTLDAQTYLEHIRRDGDRIAAVTEGHLDETVPSCPGNTVESLVMHLGGVLLRWTAALVQNKEPEPDWSQLSGDMLDAYKRLFGAFVDELASRDPNAPAWAWGSEQRVRFWYRRAAQELSIHRWDFENAIGEPLPIDPTLAADGVDELLEEFTIPPRATFQSEGIVKRFAGTGQRLRFEATDIDKAWTITTHGDRWDVSDDGEGDVTARGTASDINLFTWGRLPPTALASTGDASLLDLWQERVKI
jgi:uncharacterized protein (TIGR03083 family)